MYETTIRLGRGIIRNGCSPANVTVNGDFFLDVISKFGISREDLRKIKPTYDELLDIYFELKYFGFSTKYYLKQKPSRA
jgi:hypothetical protein